VARSSGAVPIVSTEMASGSPDAESESLLAGLRAEKQERGRAGIQGRALMRYSGGCRGEEEGGAAAGGVRRMVPGSRRHAGSGMENRRPIFVAVSWAGVRWELSRVAPKAVITGSGERGT